MTIGCEQVVCWLEGMARILEDNRDFLVELDAAIGDADHGINMDRGFKAVVRRLPDLRGQDIGTVFETVGMTLVSTVGGAAGPLYGTFFLRMGAKGGRRVEVAAQDFARMLQAAVEGVMERGKARPGDKTMVDALVPAVAAFSSRIAEDEELREALAAAAAGAESGMKATIAMQARKGRASYLGERSIGHQDPGATSVFLIFKAMSECRLSDDQGST